MGGHADRRHSLFVRPGRPRRGPAAATSADSAIGAPPLRARRLRPRRADWGLQLARDAAGRGDEGRLDWTGDPARGRCSTARRAMRAKTMFRAGAQPARLGLPLVARAWGRSWPSSSGYLSTPSAAPGRIWSARAASQAPAILFIDEIRCNTVIERRSKGETPLLGRPPSVAIIPDHRSTRLAFEKGRGAARPARRDQQSGRTRTRAGPTRSVRPDHRGFPRPTPAALAGILRHHLGLRPRGRRS